MLISGLSSFWIWFPYTFLLPLYITDTPKTSSSSQEASESSQGLQQANMVPGHTELGTLLEHVAECERPNNGKSLNVCCELHCLLPNLLVCGACVHTCFYMSAVGHKPRWEPFDHFLKKYQIKHQLLSSENSTTKCTYSFKAAFHTLMQLSFYHFRFALRCPPYSVYKYATDQWKHKYVHECLWYGAKRQLIL